MKLTVEMSPGEYDLYRSYQKDKRAMELEVEKNLRSLRSEHERLCNAVVNAVAETGTGDEPEYTIVEQKRMNDAMEIATDWFC